VAIDLEIPQWPSPILPAFPIVSMAKRTPACRSSISRGQQGKFAYDPELGVFVLKRLLPVGMTFPLGFGFIPSTKAEDGDPLDRMVVIRSIQDCARNYAGQSLGR
jgi:inorganic pyrophosphatase